MSRWLYCVAGFSLFLCTIIIGCLTAAYLLLNSKEHAGSLGSFGSNSTACRLDAEDPDLGTWTAPEDIRETCKYYLAGFDKQNRPVWVIEYGSWDLETLLEKEDYENVLDRYIQQIVYRIKCSFTIQDPRVRTWALISDLAGKTQLSALPFAIRMASKLEPFSATLDYGYVFNMSWLSHRLVRYVKPYLGPAINRTKIFGTSGSSDEWLPLILKDIPRSQLPAQFGGFANFTPYLSYSDIPMMLTMANKP